MDEHNASEKAKSQLLWATKEFSVTDGVGNTAWTTEFILSWQN